jgi:hypothetical protein
MWSAPWYRARSVGYRCAPWQRWSARTQPSGMPTVIGCRIIGSGCSMALLLHTSGRPSRSLAMLPTIVWPLSSREQLSTTRSRVECVHEQIPETGADHIQRHTDHPQLPPECRAPRVMLPQSDLQGNRVVGRYYPVRHVDCATFTSSVASGTSIVKMQP